MIREEREKAIDLLDNLIGMVADNQDNDYDFALKMGIESLREEPCEDAVSREDAIRELKQFSGTTRLRLSANFWEALNRAIKSLEQEPCEDAVSRKAVLNTLDNMDKVLDEDRTVESYKALLKECYEVLPPVIPTRKKGRWIVEDSGNYNGKYYTCYCSNCKDYYTRNWKEMKYCPNCGAEMEIEDGN